MLNIVIFGAPGSGKGTQSQLIVDKYNLTHLSTGDMLRDEIARGTEIGKFADSLISKGNLVPDDLIIKMINAKIDACKANCNGFIFDGFPRTVAQAEALDKMLADHNKKLSLMLDLRVDERLLIDRLLKRGQESGRADDNIDVIRHRLQVYHEVTMPVIEFYKTTGRYVAVEGCTTIDEYFQKIVELIEFSVCGF